MSIIFILQVALKMSETIRWMEQEQDKPLLDYLSKQTLLDLENCDKLLNCIPSIMIHRFQHIKVLQVQECGSLVEIFESEGVDSNEGNNSLLQYEIHKLRLYSLPKLMHIWKNHGGILGFQNLKKLDVGSCNNLKNVIPPSILRSLLQLEEISIYECETMEEIVANEETNEPMIILPKLSSLVLNHLSSLRCFYAGSCSIELTSCDRIIIRECSMQIFCCGTVSTPKLKTFEFEDEKIDCPNEDLNKIIQQHHKGKV